MDEQVLSLNVFQMFLGLETWRTTASIFRETWITNFPTNERIKPLNVESKRNGKNMNRNNKIRNENEVCSGEDRRHKTPVQPSLSHYHYIPFPSIPSMWSTINRRKGSQKWSSPRNRERIDMTTKINSNGKTVIRMTSKWREKSLAAVNLSFSFRTPSISFRNPLSCVSILLQRISGVQQMLGFPKLILINNSLEKREATRDWGILLWIWQTITHQHFSWHVLVLSLGNRFLTHLSSFYSRVPNIFEIEK